MTVIHCPGFLTIEEALDWFAAQGCGPKIKLYRGSDGLVRGSGVR